jgi:ribosome-binding factor A
LNEQFKREIAHILSQKVRDPRVGRIVVTEVRVTPDLWLARVFFRPIDDGASPDEILKGLDAAGSFIRRELGKVLRVRRIPELRFLHDDTLDSAQRIEDVLKEVLPEGAAVEAPEGRDGNEPADDPGAAQE